MLAERFPLLSVEDLVVLSNSLAYEADSHQDIYPNVPIIWLDEKRASVPDVRIDNYAASTLGVQADNLYHARISDPRDLQSFSFAAHYVADKTRENGEERDTQFSQAPISIAYS